jgi:hypothetical protein
MSRQKVLECPYCATTAVFELQNQATDPFTAKPRGDEHYAALYRCTNDKCRRLVYFRMGTLNDGGNLGPDPNQVVDQYPRREIRVEEGVPEGDIANDFIEAQKCYDIGAARASAAVCRRSLQAAALRLGASAEKRLQHQIDELDITKDLKHWAHQVRIIGNAGAHPDKDGLENVTADDALEAIHFAEEFYNYVFVMPERVRRRQAAKTAEPESAP